jgi:hypothetical protein
MFFVLTVFSTSLTVPVHSGGLSPLALGLIIGGAALAGAVIVGLLIYYFKTKAKSGYEAV